MGSVYVGVQIGAAGFERPVAIKRTHPHLLNDPDLRAMILQEARNASAVRHPNVVSVDDVEQVDDELLLVMDYIEGGSLHELSALAGRLPLDVALAIVLDACAGLVAIHSARAPSGAPLRLVHRDVSPQNILVGQDGMARMTDFGIAKGAADPTRTAQTARRGKFGYMAPEYILTGVATPSSDIFGLGVVLWEALAGRRLFHGDTNLDSIVLTTTGLVPPLCADNPEVPPALDALVRRMLARSPLERPRSMTELLRELEIVTWHLVAPRADVAAWIARVTGVDASPGAAEKVETVPLVEVGLIEGSAVRPITDLASRPPPLPSDAGPVGPTGAAPAATGRPPPAEGTARAGAARESLSSRRLHRAFRLEEVLDQRSETSGDASLSACAGHAGASTTGAHGSTAQGPERAERTR